MSQMPRRSSYDHALNVAFVHGCASSLEGGACLPAGHCLTRSRFRHLRASDWVIVTHDSVLMGLAAYKHADSDVRVVHELLVDKTLPAPHAAQVTDALIAALEMLACDEGVTCLMFLIYGDVVTAQFEARGYCVIVADRCGAWVQKKLNDFVWVHSSSGRPC